MRTLLLSVLCAAALPAAASENVMLVLDASGSMWGQIDGRAKIEIAREAVGRVVADWSPDNALGLVAYGHRRKGDCADIETLIPVGPLDGAAYLATVKALNPKGMTPLSQAVIDAAAALRASEQKATVILVSDGEETCNLDPCAVGRELEASGVDFTAHVIGFDVANPAHQAQLRCLAENTGGRYFNARDAVELGNAVQGAVSASTEPPPPPATATLKPQGAAAVLQPLAVAYTGPADTGDFITVVLPEAKDGDYLTYAYVPEAEAQGQVSFPMPATAGAYELRYVSPSRASQVLARVPLAIGDAEASLDAPATAVAGGTITVVAQGPDGSSHWIGFAPRGGATGAYVSNHYARPTGPRSELTLKVPADPGEYELRYVLNEAERVIASRPITVTAAQASVRAPAEVMAGSAVAIEATGPDDGSHWIGFAPAGSDAGAYIGNSYVRPSGTTTRTTVLAPAEPGEYELRYVLFEGDSVVASQPVRVLPVQIRLEAPSSAAVGSPIEVAFTGPGGRGNWIGVVPAGGDGSEYLSWDYVPEDGRTSVQLNAPDTAGAWEIVFVEDGAVKARVPLQVH